MEYGAQGHVGGGLNLSLPGLSPDEPSFWVVAILVVLVVAIVAIARSLR